MKNYYHILQIETSATKQTIKAAYKRLARKYHPDMLSSDERKYPSLLEKIQEINEAYQILSDDEKRKAYDQAYSQEKDVVDSPFETRTLLVKCGKTKHIHKMLLRRLKNTNRKFKMVGFEPIEKPSLPGTPHGWHTKISETIAKITNKSKNDLGHSLKEADAEKSVEIQGIDWDTGLACPDCAAKIVSADGLRFRQWFVCMRCKRLFCVGNITTTFLNRKISLCPWCGSETPVVFKLLPKMWGLRGWLQKTVGRWKIRGDASSKKNQNLLSRDVPKALGDGKKE